MNSSESLVPEQALDLLCQEALALGADRFDAIVGESESMGLEIFEGKVKSTEISSSRGIGIRLFRGKRPGYAFTERFTPEAIRRTIADALSHASITDEVDLDLPQPGVLATVDLQQFNPDLNQVSMEDMKSLGMELEAMTKDLDSRIENVPYLGVSTSSGQSMVRNSNGVFYRSQSNSVSAGLGVVAKLDENRKMGVYNQGGRTFSFDPKKMAQIAVDRAIELLGASSLPSGPLPIVLSHRISPQIFSMFGSPFFADAVHKGQSRLQGKLGEQIAVPEFQLISDPFIPGMPGSHYFDGEGVISRPIEVIQDGILRNYLYNLESAKKEGVTPTGNGSRGYSGKAGTGFANYIVAQGTLTLEDLLKAYPRCLYVVKLEGGSGCSAVSGEISIGVQGFLYENGNRIRPVDRVTVSINFFDLLMRIRGLSNQYSDTFSSVKVPDVLLEEVNVSG